MLTTSSILFPSNIFTATPEPEDEAEKTHMSDRQVQSTGVDFPVGNASVCLNKYHVNV